MAEITDPVVSTVPESNGVAVAQRGDSSVSNLPQQPTTASGIAEKTGGVGPGNLMEVDVDKNLYQFNPDDTALMQMMLMAKRVPVTSPEIQHYVIDNPAYRTMTTMEVAPTTGTGRVEMCIANPGMCPAHSTLLVPGVNGYDPTGLEETPGEPLMLLVVETNKSTGMPVVMAINGKKTRSTDKYRQIPNIPQGSEIIELANAMFETQELVPADSIIPIPRLLYAQKRGMNSIVSDYFESHAKRIPFAKALIAETQIRAFKLRGNRSLWVSRPGKVVVNTDLGEQTLYTTEGVRWQIKRELDKSGRWTFEELIALTKMIFTGEDVPSTVILLAGKNLIENLQCIDFSKHPEVKISVDTNKFGWKVTSVHTVFGSLEFKHEPTLDRLGYSNSGAVLAPEHMIHYVYSQEHSRTEKIDGHEATRTSVIVWDALGLKGASHIWINGEGEGANTTAVSYAMWSSASAPEVLPEGKVFAFAEDCPEAGASAGDMKVVKDGQLVDYDGELSAE